MTTLDAAREWGTPPWELDGGSKLIWYLRYRVYNRIRMQVSETKRREAESR